MDGEEGDDHDARTLVKTYVEHLEKTGIDSAVLATNRRGTIVGAPGERAKRAVAALPFLRLGLSDGSGASRTRPGASALRRLLCG